MKKKHPSADVRKGIMCFHDGAYDGPDGLCPGHFRSQVGHSSAQAGLRLQSSLTDTTNVMLRGKVPEFAVYTLYGANDCGIKKKNGCI